jgi:peptidoglycan/xylan/chitin deacetylase (PgdA/CDA1 family)
MSFLSWYRKRGPRFIRQRGINLLKRYGLTPEKAVHRIEDCVETLAGFGCAPTFPTPGIIVEQTPQFIRHLQDFGAEIAVHSYNHKHLNSIPVDDAIQQLMRAVQTFERFGIEVHGFRSPYLACSDEIIDALPKGLFSYSSNKAIQWDPELDSNQVSSSLMYETIRKFYSPRPAQSKVCVPWTLPDIVEIPVCVPDDLELHDGLNLDLERMAQVWFKVLQQTHQRGELFNLMFHPELADACEAPFMTLLREVKNFHPHVWIAQLKDISNWWKEKANFKVDIAPSSTGQQLSFICTPRATILARGLNPGGSGTIWGDGYYLLQSKILTVPVNPRPFIGIATDVPSTTISFLTEQGYILDSSETARFCGIYLDASTLSKLTNEVELVNHIEASTGPLVRYWRWPDGAKSALSITGDLDALSLIDYASRFFI